MKRIFIIVCISLLTVFFYSQTTIIADSLHSFMNTEYFVDASVQIEDNCQEDGITNNSSNSFHKISEGYFFVTLYPFTIGITSFVWHPPE
jgi:hypothetical protein